MKTIYRQFEKIYSLKVNALGLALFRMVFALVLFANVFTTVSVLNSGNAVSIEVGFREFHLCILSWIWCTVIFLILVGLATRTAALVNFLLVIFLGYYGNLPFSETVHYSFPAASLLILFIPVSKVASLDNLLKRLKYSNTRFNFVPDQNVSILYVWTLLFFTVALVYFDKSLNFLFSGWQISASGLSQVADYLGGFLGNNFSSSKIDNILWQIFAYALPIFQIIFLLFFFVKKSWLFLGIFGIILHLIIFSFIPVAPQSYGIFGLLILLLPPVLFQKLFSSIKLKESTLIFFYDEECPLCNRTKITLSFFDIFDAIQFKGVQTYGFNHPLLKNIPQNELLNNIYSIDRKGSVFEGVYTYRQAFLRIPLFFLLGVAMFLPGIKHLALKIYGVIAGTRIVERCTEDNCGYEIPKVPQDPDLIKLSQVLYVRELRLTFIVTAISLATILQIILSTSSLNNNSRLQSYAIDRNTSIIPEVRPRLSGTFLGIDSYPFFGGLLR